MRLLAVLALLLAARAAGAATFVEISVEDVARSADAVVRARVLSTAGRQARDGRIVTDVDLEVLGAWKGDPGPRVRIVVPGGSLGRVALAVDAAPRFRRGEEAVVFLAREGSSWIVAGWALGKFRVDGAEAAPDSAGAHVLPRAIAPGERRVEPMPVAELERRVRAAR